MKNSCERCKHWDREYAFNYNGVAASRAACNWALGRGKELPASVFWTEMNANQGEDCYCFEALAAENAGGQHD